MVGKGLAKIPSVVEDRGLFVCALRKASVRPVEARGATRVLPAPERLSDRRTAPILAISAWRVSVCVPPVCSQERSVGPQRAGFVG